MNRFVRIRVELDLSPERADRLATELSRAGSWPRHGPVGVVLEDQTAKDLLDLSWAIRETLRRERLAALEWEERQARVVECVYREVDRRLAREFLAPPPLLGEEESEPGTLEHDARRRLAYYSLFDLDLPPSDQDVEDVVLADHIRLVAVGLPQGRARLAMEKMADDLLSPLQGTVYETDEAFLDSFDEPAPTCTECGRDLHGYRGPLCRYCDGTAE